jgi:hypothetical protein
VLARSWLIPTARFGRARLAARRSHSSRAIVPTRPQLAMPMATKRFRGSSDGRDPFAAKGGAGSSLVRAIPINGERASRQPRAFVDREVGLQAARV